MSNLLYLCRSESCHFHGSYVYGTRNDQLSQDPKESWWLFEGRVCFMT